MKAFRRIITLVAACIAVLAGLFAFSVDYTPIPVLTTFLFLILGIVSISLGINSLVSDIMKHDDTTDLALLEKYTSVENLDLAEKLLYTRLGKEIIDCYNNDQEDDLSKADSMMNISYHYSADLESLHIIKNNRG